MSDRFRMGKSPVKFKVSSDDMILIWSGVGRGRIVSKTSLHFFHGKGRWSYEEFEWSLCNMRETTSFVIYHQKERNFEICFKWYHLSFGVDLKKSHEL